MDTTGQSLAFDMDYALFSYDGSNNQTGEYFDKNQVNLNHNIAVNTLQGNKIRILTSKLDYILPINKNVQLEAGLKTSFVNTDSLI